MTCDICGKAIVADSCDINRLMREHKQREHIYGYCRYDSWKTCPDCRGNGKATNGLICKRCDGSGKISI